MNPTPPLAARYYGRQNKSNRRMDGFLENVSGFIQEAASLANIAKDVLAKMEKPDRALEFQIPVAIGGVVKNFPAWRVQHNNALGPYKGGIRFHPDSTLNEVQALASLMTWKTAVAGLPLGGAKGAVRVNPREFSSAELEEISRGYVRGTWRHIGPDKDIPAPDVGTDAQIMDWMADEYGTLTGKWEPAAFTGKSIAHGGSLGREIATGFGGYVILREFLNLQNAGRPQSAGHSVAIQGFGNVGSNIAKILFERGFKIVAISDSKGGLYEKDGIDIHKVLSIKKKTGIIDRGLCYAAAGPNLASNAPCQSITNNELLELPVDILVPAALENQITGENVERIRACVILEMANGPVSHQAEQILSQKNVTVIPDILANGGGVAGSYFEWLQSREQKYWSENEVLEKIDRQMTDAFQAVNCAREEYQTTWRLASYATALARVASKIKKGYSKVSESRIARPKN